MIDVLLKLLDLPWQTLVALASGGAAYLLSYMGMRSEHRVYEATFITLIYALIATAVMALMQSWLGWPILSGIAAFAASCGAGLIWRKWLRAGMHWLLRKWKISWSNDDPSAWATLMRNDNIPLTQISVELDDGTWLICEEADRFRDAARKPLTMGLNGDIAFYPTHIEHPGEDMREQDDVRNENGDRIAYIPAARVRQVHIRYKKTTSV